MPDLIIYPDVKFIYIYNIMISRKHVQNMFLYITFYILVLIRLTASTALKKTL